MKRRLFLAFLVCVSPAARSQTSVPDSAAYPGPQCVKPRIGSIKPPKSELQIGVGGGPVVYDSGAVGSYNSRIKVFNRDAAAYNACMRAYIDNASREVKVIQDKANADLKQITAHANASMKVIQDQIQKAAAEASEIAAAMDQETAKLRKQ